MARLPTFTSITEALSRGADLAIARSISLGSSIAEATSRAISMFGGKNKSAAERVVEFGAAESSAASGLKRYDTAGNFPLSDVPIQPYLFGDEPGGDRVIIGVELTDAAGNRIIHIPIRGSGNKSIDEMIAEATAATRNVWRKYPGRLKIDKESDIEELNVGFTYAARRF